MKGLGFHRRNRSGHRRGLFGVTLGGALTACVVLSGNVLASPGSSTATTSTTCHTSFGCPAHTETAVTTTTTFGPGTILIGEKQSQTFFVEPGTINVNTNTHTETFVCAAAAAASAPALTPAGLAGFAILLAGYGIRRLGRPRALL